jgi:AraC family transcriptional activator FtrA
MPKLRNAKKILAARHRVVVLAYDELYMFEFGIAVEMFGLPRPELDRWYSFSVCGLDNRPVRATGGITITPDGGLSGLRRADTIIIPGWRKPYEPPPPQLIRALIRAHERGARLVSICVGSFVLGATGLLNGRRATTHWRHIDEMVRQFPLIQIQPDVLYVDEEDILTSAGSAAGIDLCLHIIRKDFGTVVARRAVVSPHREGGQAQFIDKPVGEEAHPWLSHLLNWTHTRLHIQITVEQLARETHTSMRTLSRRFTEANGISPLHWITVLRVQRVKDLLETTALSMEEVAEKCGFGTAALLRHHFRMRVKLSPKIYRDRFHQRTPATY